MRQNYKNELFCRLKVGLGRISGMAGNPAGYGILKLSGWLSSIVGYSAILYWSYPAGYPTI